MNSTYWINRVMSTMYPSSNATGFYIGLSSTKPTDAGGNVSEPSGNNYSRVQVTAFTSPSDGVVKNKNALSFPRSSGIWFPTTARAEYWVLFDGNDSSAHVLSCGAITEPLTIWGGAAITIAEESISITLRDGT